MITTSKSTTAGTLALGQHRKRTVNDPTFAAAHELAAAIRERRISAVEVLDAHLTRIARYNPALNAIVTHNEENARAGAREADAALARGEVWGPLHGVPVTIKDSFATAGLRTTSGFPPLTNHIPDSDATAVARLRAAGAIVLGKTNLPLLVHGFQSDNPIFGRTNNPWDHARTPGGSTGGGAAAIAAGLSPLELGSDYGGSVRIPAHFCGIYSLKPTNNRIPLTGHIPELPGRRSVRHVATPGPLARCVQDLVLALQVMAGPDPYHPDVPPLPLTPAPEPAWKDLRVAWVEDFGGIRKNPRMTSPHLGGRAERTHKLPCVCLIGPTDETLYRFHRIIVPMSASLAATTKLILNSHGVTSTNSFRQFRIGGGRYRFSSHSCLLPLIYTPILPLRGKMGAWLLWHPYRGFNPSHYRYVR